MNDSEVNSIISNISEKKKRKKKKMGSRNN